MFWLHRHTEKPIQYSQQIAAPEFTWRHLSPILPKAKVVCAALQAKTLMLYSHVVYNTVEAQKDEI